MERVRENWTLIAVFGLLVGGGAYINTIDTGLGRFLWAVSALAAGVVVLGPPIKAATRPLWSRMTSSSRQSLTGVLFASPWMIGFLVFTLGPMLFALYVSFCSYHLTDNPVWKGWNYNYGQLFQHDPDFITALHNTFYYVIVKTPVIIVVSLLVALLLNTKVPGVRIFRTIFYMPTVVTGVGAIFLWVWIMNPRGLLNTVLGFLHVPGQLWFYDPTWSKPGLIIMSVWYLGAPMLILLAGLNGIPRSLYEAAEIDGAGIFRKFWNVTIPMLSPTLFFIILTQIIGAFQVFNSAYVISTSAHVTNANAIGDPQNSLLFAEVYIYYKFAEPFRDIGYAAAISWILFVIIMTVTGIQLWLSRRWVYYESD